MLKQVAVFLTPNPQAPSEPIVGAFPDPVRLVINVEVDDQGNQTVTEVDEVVWQYSQQAPPESGLDSFPGAPDPAEINVEVRLPPEDSPFGSDSSDGSTGSFSMSTDSVLPGPETSSYENIGTNPLVPNKPRLDSAPPPSESTSFALATESNGDPAEYEYAVILTSRTNVSTVDPKIIIIRRHRRTSL
jgi:hypothetical protein